MKILIYLVLFLIFSPLFNTLSSIQDFNLSQSSTNQESHSEDNHDHDHSHKQKQKRLYRIRRPKHKNKQSNNEEYIEIYPK